MRCKGLNECDHVTCETLVHVASRSAASSSGSGRLAPPASCRESKRVGEHPIRHVGGETRSSTRSEAETTVPPGSCDFAFTTVSMAGPCGAAAETPPVSTAATAASTAQLSSVPRCGTGKGAQRPTPSGRYRWQGGAVEREVLACKWSCPDAKDAHPDRARRPQG